jgi:hypothetical protein
MQINKQHKVVVTKYREALGLKQLPRSEWGNTSEDRTFVSFISAMAEQDFDWWVEAWAEKDRQKVLLLDANKKQEMMRSWVGLIKKKPIIVDSKVEFQYQGRSYAVFNYRITNLSLVAVDPSGRILSSAKNTELEQQAVFVVLSNKWFATQDVSSNPVFFYSSEIASSKENTIRVSRE